MNKHYSPFRVAVIYAFFGMVWILLSDTALHALIQDIELERRLQTVKGWVFIGVTGALVYWLTSQMAKELKGEVGERKEAEYELEFQKKALDEHAIVSITNAKGDIIYANDKFCDISGYSRDELYGQNHRLLKSDEHSLEFFNDLWQTIAKGKTWNGEIKNIKKGGGFYWVKATIVPFLNEQGKPFRYVAIRTDITKRRAIEDALRNAEERISKSQSFANIGTWDWNIESGELLWSDRVAALFGGNERSMETSYDNFVNAVHPDDRKMVIDAVNACVEKNENYDIEHRVIWPDGVVRWLHESGDVTRDDEGKPLHMLGVVRDIDARKRTELALIERERQLHESQSLAHLGSWQANLISGKLTWTDEIYRIFGHEPGSFEPSVQAFHAAVHPDDLEKVHESERRAEKTGHHDVTHRIVRPDGTVRHVHELARAETDAAGNLVRMIGSVQDITELRQSQEAAEQANQAKSEFLSSMSHELRTPMNAILGFGQLLEHNPAEPLSKAQSEHVQHILKGGDHLLELIDQVLELSKIEAGKISLSIENVNSIDNIEECLAMVGNQAKGRNIELEFSPPDFDLPSLQTDYNRFKQVLLNLLTNAIKYNSEGGKVTVSVSLAENDFLRISVADTGYGIPLEKQEGLFEPFNRLGREAGEIEGTGIGLTITKEIVELLGGQIGFESEENVGSAFWIELPQSDEQSVDGTDQQTEAIQGISAETSTSSGVVLYIEDNPANIRLMEAIIERLPDLSLKSAHTAELGLDMARDIHPDIILMDINLPVMDGIAALNRLRANDQTKDTPVIAISAAAMPNEIERGKAAGFEDYLTKPINVPEVIKAINKHIK